MEIQVLAGACEVHLCLELVLFVKSRHVGCEYQRGTFSRSDLLENRSGFRVPNSYHGGHSRLEDAGFLESYFRTGGTKQRTVVQAYGCDHRKHRSNDVCAVQTAAQADFNHGGIHTLAGEPPEGHASCNLKERQPFCFTLV